MALTFHDPGHIGMRRGIRAAIAMPIVLLITLFVLDDRIGAIYAGFGTAGLLITADYAGSWQRRLTSYLATGVAGTVALVIGWAASQNTVAAVLTTAVVAFGLAFISLLRGVLAIGSPAVLLIFIVSVTIGGPETVVAHDVAGWWVAVTVSTITALFVLPHDVRTEIRDALGSTLLAVAAVTESAWLTHESPQDYERRLDVSAAAFDKLNATYDGKPFRPTGASTRDQALTLMVSVLNSARLLLAGTIETVPGRAALPPIDGRDDMARALVAVIRVLAAAVHDPAVVPSGKELDRTRQVHMDATDAWVLASSQAGTDAEVIAQVLKDDHLLRVAAVMGEQMAALGRELNGAPPEDLDNEPPLPQRPWSTVMHAHLNVHSPWLRTAIRTGIGLAIAVFVVRLTDVQHGFWVLLGVLAVLRYDLTATARMAWLAILGTVLGVVVGTGVILLVGPNAILLWLLLPVAVFLAAWAPVATNYPLGQGAFTLFILLILGIVNWPPDLTAGLVRIEDILIGVGVAIVVGFLMWPRGALGAMHEEVAAALRQCSAYLSRALECLIEPTQPADLAKARLDARAASERASETYDMAIMQRGAAATVGTEWAALTTASHLLLAVGRIMGVFLANPPRLAGNADNVRVVATAREASDEHWNSVVVDLADTGRAPRVPPAEPLDLVPVPSGVVDLSTANDYVITVWVVNWVDHLNRLSPRQPIQKVTAAHGA